ncbi:MAG: bifunctional diaminohydroxyphosphoribosylaminopyrimidine deaminase/5-amino-6-(5-phosphoribosylamino)uracil reductase RibD, partial [Dehalococcoidia bacterium]
MELARAAKGDVSPRPPVGAVIVQDGQIVGEGATEPRPGKHAEAIALDQAGDRARGATIYCTLEPHAFQGVAAPCTDLIISAGIKKVVCPIEDPNPQVSGNGFRQLKA